MPRRNYTRAQTQRSKRARQHRKEAIFAGLWHWWGHPSHIAWRPNRNGHRRYQPRRH